MIEVRHAGIVVSNPVKSLEFYRGLLGLKVTKDAEESGEYIDCVLRMKRVKVRTIKLTGDNAAGMIELLYFKSPKSPKKKREFADVGCSHVAFTVSDVEAKYKKLVKKGVVFNSPPKISPDKYAKVAFCKDPDGESVELVEVLQK